MERKVMSDIEGKAAQGSSERTRAAGEFQTKVARVLSSFSGRFTRHCWRLDVYIDFLRLSAATAEKLAAEEEERSGHDDHKDNQYGHDCGVASTTIVISHKIDPPLCAHDSHLTGDVTV